MESCSCAPRTFPRYGQRCGRGMKFAGPRRAHHIFVAAGDRSEMQGETLCLMILQNPQGIRVAGKGRNGTPHKTQFEVMLDSGFGHDHVERAQLFGQGATSAGSNH